MEEGIKDREKGRREEEENEGEKEGKKEKYYTQKGKLLIHVRTNVHTYNSTYITNLKLSAGDLELKVNSDGVEGMELGLDGVCEQNQLTLTVYTQVL